MWDQRYGGEDFAYGTEPNDFLRDHADRIPEGPVLCLAEGEGRNAVFLAARGHPVLAVDQSPVGLAKARRLAEDREVSIDTEVADLAEWNFPVEAFAGVVSIFGHLPPPVRRRVHAAAVRALRPGGVLLLEAYAPGQVGRGTGGPPVVEMTMSLDDLREELAGLEFERAEELERSVLEGRYHTGEASVVQIIGRKPA